LHFIPNGYTCNSVDDEFVALGLQDGIDMTNQRKPARRYAQNTEMKRTNAVETAAKLTQLTERARRVGAAQGPLAPVEALMTIESDAWIWQTVDRDVLDMLSHRLVLQTEDGRRRELFMTKDLDSAMDAASRIVEFNNGVVLIETLDP
jgi:hypothetical protein